jgi:putative PIG3 family NAD(P)H quinone oxidoreductase
MNVVAIAQPGGPEVLQPASRPELSPGPGEVLIRVRAAGVNRADVAQRKGHYPAPAGTVADIPGLEVAGEIAACGAGATRWQRGDAVCALLSGGGYAEYVTVDAGHCLPVPAGWSFNDAAALPEAVLTVWSNVFQRGRLAAGESFLVHGGTSGIGMAAIQLAGALGARVFATAGSDEKCSACRAAGATQAINYRREDFAVVLKDAGVDVILDMIGGEYFDRNIRLLRPEGRLVFINAMRGAKTELNIMHVMAKRLTITGSTLRSRETEYKRSLTAEVEQQVWPLLRAGRYRPNVFKVFPLAAAAEAHRLMESSEHIGKIVLAV